MKETLKAADLLLLHLAAELLDFLKLIGLDEVDELHFLEQVRLAASCLLVGVEGRSQQVERNCAVLPSVEAQCDFRWATGHVIELSCAEGGVIAYRNLVSASERTWIACWVTAARPAGI